MRFYVTRPCHLVVYRIQMVNKAREQRRIKLYLANSLSLKIVSVYTIVLDVPFVLCWMVAKL